MNKSYKTIESNNFTIIKNTNIGDIPVTGITLSETNKTIHCGEFFKLTPTFTPNNATNKGFTLSTSDDSIAITHYDGRVEGTSKINNKTCTITCRSHSNRDVTATCIVTVLNENGTLEPTDDIDVTIKDFKAILKNKKTNVTEKFDVAYDKSPKFKSYRIIKDNNIEYYLNLSETGDSSFVINNKKPVNGGYNDDVEYNLLSYAYAYNNNKLNYSVKNLPVRPVNEEVLQYGLDTFNCAHEKLKITLDQTSDNEVESDYYEDEWLGLCSTWARRFAICMNKRKLGEEPTNGFRSTMVHELGHTIGLPDESKNWPTMYSYSRNREKCLYLQPTDIYCFKEWYKDMLNGTRVFNEKDIIKFDKPIVLFDYEKYENEEDLIANSDICINAKFVGNENPIQLFSIGTENYPFNYKVYNFKVNNITKGSNKVDDIVKVKVHESINLNLINDNSYNLFLCEYENSPCSLINIEQGIKESRCI